MPETLHALGEVAWDVLRRMVRELLARKPGGHLAEAQLREIDLRLPLVMQGPGAEPRRFSAELVTALERAVNDAVVRAAAFRPGFAFCHRCAAAACEHSRPPSCRHVFGGYAPTGIPQWEEFSQVCLENGHPEVDRLFEQPPAFITEVQAGTALRQRLLKAFRADNYDVLGQLLAGFFRVRTREGEGRGALALTFQVVVTRSSSGRVYYALNVLGVAPGGEDLETLWERFEDVPWRRATRWAQTALSTLNASGRGGRGRRRAPSAAERQHRVEGILRGLARRLERDVRGRARRTRHAEQRHRSGARPTRMAIEDIRKARAEAFLVDEKRGTLVVLGERGRTHFFTLEGRLVSSVRYSRDAIERKRKLGLWRRASADEAGRLREALSQSA